MSDVLGREKDEYEVVLCFKRTTKLEFEHDQPHCKRDDSTCSTGVGNIIIVYYSLIINIQLMDKMNGVYYGLDVN